MRELFKILLALFLLSGISLGGDVYTKPGTWGYDFSDVEAQACTEVLMTPHLAMATAQAESGADLTFRATDTEAHGSNANSVFGDIVLDVPNEPIVIDFPTPVWNAVVYIGSDVYNDDRLSYCEAYSADGTYIGGDSAVHPYGPLAEPLPAGYDPATTDFQYMVVMVFTEPFPGYTPKPIAKLVFHPDGDDVFIGRVFGTTD